MQGSTSFEGWLPYWLKLGCLVLLAVHGRAASASAYAAALASLAVAMVLLSLAKREVTLRNVLVSWVLASVLGWALAGMTSLLAPRTPSWWFYAYLTAQGLMVLTQDIREGRS